MAREARSWTDQINLARLTNAAALTLLILAVSFLAACTTAEAENPNQSESGVLNLPIVHEAALDEGEALKVLATTSIIGDVVSQIGAPYIDLTILMKPGQDPHGYQPSAGDLAAASQAQVIFVNGWDLEEGLVADLVNAAGDSAVIPISAGIKPLLGGDPNISAGESTSSNSAPDPHVWLDPNHVKQWARNVFEVLSTMDPANKELYQENLEGYLQGLDELVSYIEAETSAIPPERRLLVTNHDSLAYFAAAYDFQIVGTVIPGASTLAETSASALTNLITAMEDSGVCAIFSESTANSDLAETVVMELEACDEVRVITLYTGALGSASSGADTYIDMMKTNVDAIVEGAGLAAN